jgi:hypothetical protein|tara:strand:+ start:697 stop:948 length:252 start_codon:yes stop_codon:yes gene_type:complete
MATATTATESTTDFNEDLALVMAERQMRLRCFEMSLQIKQQESMHRFQMWNQTGKQGDSPELHTMDEVFDHATTVYDFIIDSE